MNKGFTLPYISQVLQGVASVTSCHFNVFYIFLHLKPRFPHRVETALAFSGGGGRALAFSLGVLRALEHLGLMRLEWFCSATSGSHCDMICVDRMCGSVLEYVGSH